MFDMKYAITIKNLNKTYKTHYREPGLVNAIKSIFKRQYETKHAVKNVSFKVKTGEILGLIGPNGAGKSTIIKALSGILHPTTGKIKSLGFIPWKQRTRYVKNLGVVLGQKSQLWWDLPAKDTYEMHREIYSIPRETYKKRLGYMTKMLQIEDVIKTPVRDMSLGERMKSKLIASLLHNPKLVLLDEPSIGLDIIAKDRMRDFIKQVNKKKKTTFIITTHDMQDIEKLCKRIIIIDNGQIIYNGPLKKIMKKFLNKKIINVKADSKIPSKLRLKNCRIIEQKKYKLKIEISTKKTKIKDIVNYLITKLDIADITISEPPIEEIIQEIYMKNA